MKQFLICASVVAAALCTNLTAMARNPEKQESRHVIVTLKSGEKSTDTSTAAGMPKVPSSRRKTTLSR